MTSSSLSFKDKYKICLYDDDDVYENDNDDDETSGFRYSDKPEDLGMQRVIKNKNTNFIACP